MNNTSETSAPALWPEDYLAPDLGPDHCADVIGGSYDVPFEKKAPVILDIGANIGAFVRWAAARWKKPTIYCYEPHPRNYALLRRTIAAIDNPKAVIFTVQKAVLNKEDKMTLTAGEYNCGEHSLCAPKDTGRPSVEVDVIDAKNLPEADILKIDAEGAEAAILESLDKAGRLKEFSAIMLEYHADVIEQGVTRLMRARGFMEVGRRTISQHRGEIKFMRGDLVAKSAEQNGSSRSGAAGSSLQSHFLCIIAHDGNITANTMEAVMTIQHTKRAWAGWKFDMAGGQVLSRNKCLNAFMQQTPCSHAIFIDGDVIPRDEHVLALRRHPEAADSIICGVYCKKEDRISHVYNSIKGGNPAPNKLGLMEVAKGGTGMMQIPRVALEKIQAKFPERAYKCDYDYTPDGQRTDKYSYFFHDIRMDSELGFMRDQSEDWAFCELAKAAGVKIYVDVSTTTWNTSDKPPVLHRGAIEFPLRTELERMQAVDSLEQERAAHAKEVSELNAQIASLLKNVRI